MWLMVCVGFSFLGQIFMQFMMLWYWNRLNGLFRCDRCFLVVLLWLFVRNWQFCSSVVGFRNFFGFYQKLGQLVEQYVYRMYLQRLFSLVWFFGVCRCLMVGVGVLFCRYGCIFLYWLQNMVMLIIRFWIIGRLGSGCSISGFLFFFIFGVIFDSGVIQVRLFLLLMFMLLELYMFFWQEW